MASRISQMEWTPTMKEDLLEHNRDNNLELLKKWELREVLIPQDVSDQHSVLHLRIKNDTTAVKTDALLRTLEDFEDDRDAHISDVAKLILEMNGQDSKRKLTQDEIIDDIKSKINLEEGSDHLNVDQFMEYLGNINEMEVDAEEEILKAFKVFDKSNTGKICPNDLKNIMEESGNILDELDLKRFMDEFERHSEADRDHDDDVEFEDVGIDYAAFVKAIMEKINNQEMKLWGAR